MNVPEELKAVIAVASLEHRLPPDLVAAICFVESGMDTWAVRFEPRWRWWNNPVLWARKVATTHKTERILQQCSWGLMQIVGATARDRGFALDFPQLCIPKVGIEYGCKHLRWNIDRWKGIEQAVQAYNAGRPGTTAGLDYAKKVWLLRRDSYLENSLST